MPPSRTPRRARSIGTSDRILSPRRDIRRVSQGPSRGIVSPEELARLRDSSPCPVPSIEAQPPIIADEEDMRQREETVAMISSPPADSELSPFTPLITTRFGAQHKMVDNTTASLPSIDNWDAIYNEIVAELSSNERNSACGMEYREVIALQLDENHTTRTQTDISFNAVEAKKILHNEAYDNIKEEEEKYLAIHKSLSALAEQQHDSPSIYSICLGDSKVKLSVLQIQRIDEERKLVQLDAEYSELSRQRTGLMEEHKHLTARQKQLEESESERDKRRLAGELFRTLVEHQVAGVAGWDHAGLIHLHKVVDKLAREGDLDSDISSCF